MTKINTMKVLILAIAIAILLPINHYAKAFLLNSSQNKEISQVEEVNKEVEQVAVENIQEAQGVAVDNIVEEKTEKVVVDNLDVSKTYYVTVTAYSSTPDQTDSTPFITANGSHVYDGTLAANFLPFGTKVRFPDYSGNKVYTVEDRMNRRYPNRADIWFSTRQGALNFGIRDLKMEVLN